VTKRFILAFKKNKKKYLYSHKKAQIRHYLTQAFVKAVKKLIRQGKVKTGPVKKIKIKVKPKNKEISNTEF
jgi:hypothetical protein